ncbi:MAG: bifunctional DNA-formamidopyrimidine glycosylase/DNA-(apurinic or apyrimidinic site) lyase [Methylococcales bacterium]|nr:bifunctional DNA-formamidopyrimidine glycosylase/DNA-(apurinic or apyrimidinic site) lyase [Methylococcales bacterium]
MPELPEVETICRGIAPHIIGKTIELILVRQPKLRWPVSKTLAVDLAGLTIRSVTRRAKYLLLVMNGGTLLVHLGMSGSLRIVTTEQEAAKHDHVDILFTDGTVLCYNDPRRFGAVLWTKEVANEHKLLKSLGVEPLSEACNGELLFQLSRKRKVPIKSFIMNSHIVVGVGNIYANEALFMAGLLPTRHAETLDLDDCQRLIECIKRVLSNAIEQGGTTLRDFVNESGKAGYFQQQLRVYGRKNLPCVTCQQPLQEVRLANRSTVFCCVCQK